MVIIDALLLYERCWRDEHPLSCHVYHVCLSGDVYVGSVLENPSWSIERPRRNNRWLKNGNGRMNYDNGVSLDVNCLMSYNCRPSDVRCMRTGLHDHCHSNKHALPGDVYVGGWRRDEKHGTGTLTQNDGELKTRR